MAETRRFLEVRFPAIAAANALLVPLGMATPHGRIDHVEVTGARVIDIAHAVELGLGAMRAEPTADEITVRYLVGPPAGDLYAQAAFRPRRNRWTAASEALADASQKTAAKAGGGMAAIQALVDEARARFSYAHPEVKFNDGAETVPYLSCGTTPGSCVDINTYLIASLRAAGFEAAYLYGYFFPAERCGVTNDMHCWVTTRHDGHVLEWDIAHHIKAGLPDIRPALDPKPGERVAIGHSMGHRYIWPDLTLETKLLAEPVWLTESRDQRIENLTITFPPQS